MAVVRSFIRFIFAIHVLSYGSAMAISRGCRVCTSSSCTPNGSELLLDALQRLAISSPEIQVQRENCLGGCGGGVILKVDNKKRTLKPLSSERMAVLAAADLLREVDGLDETSLSDLETKLAAGERVLTNTELPEFCAQCGSGLQLYRGNCAKCGRYPY